MEQAVHQRKSIRLRGYDYGQAGVYFITLCTQQRLALFGTITEGIVVLNDAGRMVQTVWNEIPDHYPGFKIDVSVVMPDHFHGIIQIVGDGNGNGHPRGGAPTKTGGAPTTGTGDIVGAGPRACPIGINDNLTNGNGLKLKGHPRGGAPTKTGDAPTKTGDAPTKTGDAPTETGCDRTETGDAPTETVARSIPDIVHRFKTMTTKKYTDGVKQNGWRPFPGRLWQRNYYEHIVRNDTDWNRIRHYIMNNPMKWHLDENQAFTSNERAPTGGCPDGRFPLKQDLPEHTP